MDLEKIVAVTINPKLEDALQEVSSNLPPMDELVEKHPATIGKKVLVARSTAGIDFEVTIELLHLSPAYLEINVWNKTAIAGICKSPCWRGNLGQVHDIVYCRQRKTGNPLSLVNTWENNMHIANYYIAPMQPVCKMPLETADIGRLALLNALYIRAYLINQYKLDGQPKRFSCLFRKLTMGQLTKEEYKELVDLHNSCDAKLDRIMRESFKSFLASRGKKKANKRNKPIKKTVQLTLF